MARLSEEERQALRALTRQPNREPPLRREERFVAPTTEARERYTRFATQASRFYKGDRPVRFRGNHWRL